MAGEGLLRICQRAAEAALQPGADASHRQTFADALAELHALADAAPTDASLAQLDAEALLPACKLAALDGDWPAASAALQRAAAATERFPKFEPIAAAEASALELVWWRANQFPDTTTINARTQQRLNDLRDRFPNSDRIRQARANAHMATARDIVVGPPVSFRKKP